MRKAAWEPAKVLLWSSSISALANTTNADRQMLTWEPSVSPIYVSYGLEIFAVLMRAPSNRLPPKDRTSSTFSGP